MIDLPAEFDAALDALEAAIQACPADRWDASLWRVRLSDPWIGAPGRTEAQVQVFSAFWMVAYHCLHHVDFYLWDGTDKWRPPARFEGGPELQPIGADGAAVLPDVHYSREDLLGYVAYCRSRARSVLATVTEEQLQLRGLPARHPHRGKTFGELLAVNLAHMREHAEQMATARSA